MIYYVNIALSVFLVSFVLSQLKAESRITQNHFDGDWRQRLHEIFTHEDFNLLLFGLYIVFVVVALIILIIIWLLNNFFNYINLSHVESASIDILIGYIVNIIVFSVFPPFLGALPIALCIIFIEFVLGVISNFIYYEPKGKHCLVKSKSSGKYTIYSFNYKLPNPDYILQHLGESNNSEFNSKQEVLNAILKLDNRDNIMSKLSNKD